MEESACWPRFLFGPDEGHLNDDELSEMVSVFDAFTGGQDCFFRFAEMPFITTDKPILFRGDLRELSTFLKGGKYQFTPEYWWPADHSWCVCSDYDLVFTIVAGSKELVSSVLNDGTLETLQVVPSTRIDNYAPVSKISRRTPGPMVSRLIEHLTFPVTGNSRIVRQKVALSLSAPSNSFCLSVTFLRSSIQVWRAYD